MKITCNIIESLLPLYADDLVSEDSIALVEEHLDTCESCQAKLKELQEGGTPLYDIDEVSGQNLAMSNTLVKIKKNYHWFLMNIGYVLFMISAVFYTLICELPLEIMYIDSQRQIVTYIMLSCTFVFTLILMVARFFCRNKTIPQKDTLNKITILSSVLLINFMFVFSFIGKSYTLVYHLGSNLALVGTLMYIALTIYKLYNLSFTITDTQYIKNTVWFLVVTAGIMMFDKFKIYAYWLFSIDQYLLYSSTVTLVVLLMFLVFAIKFHNFDTEKPKQVVTKEYKILQLATIIIGIFLQAFCVILYSAKFGDNFFDESFLKMIRFMIDISNFIMIPLTLVLPYCLYLIFKQKQYVPVFIMMQTIALLYQKVELLDVILGNMDSPTYLTLGIFWVFYATLIPTAIYTIKLKKTS